MKETKSYKNKLAKFLKFFLLRDFSDLEKEQYN